MTEKILGVRFNNVNKITYFKYLFNNNSEEISVGDIVIAETKRGIEHGKVQISKDILNINFMFTLDTDEKIIRKATKKDLEIIENISKDKKKAFELCTNKILEHKLPMSLINIEYLFDRKKMIFYFISDLRIDFRNLAKELATMFKARIELRQLGPREQAKILGDLGVCGRSLCCKTFLDDYELISIKTAKDQGVSMNPIKLSGICGKLKCCLKFEENLYIDHSQEPEKNTL